MQTQSYQMAADTLHNEAKLYENSYITSKNGMYFARMQDDGNFVIYNGTNFQSQNAVWASNTGGKGSAPFHLAMQNDGNLVVYDRYNKPTWASDTWGKGQAPYKLVMQDDRNLVVYDRFNTATWSSNTYDNNYKNQQNQSYGNYNQNQGYNQNQSYGNYNQNQNYNYVQINDTLHNEATLHQGSYITSKNQMYHARMQDDGNFVCYNGLNFQSNYSFWASNTGGVGQAPFKLVMQNDANLCVYDRTGKATWCSQSWGKGQAPYKLVMQDDRNLVIYDRNNTAIWASNTYF